MTEVKRATDFIGSPGERNRLPKCSFHFDVPDCLDCELLGHNSGFLQDLPASIPPPEPSQKPTLQQPLCQGECHIAYTLRVQVLCNEEVLASCTNPIRIIPTLCSRPPICVADFPDEYVLTTSKFLRAGFLGMHHIGDWRLEAGQPLPVVLSHVTDHVSLSTSLKLTQRTYPTSNFYGGSPRDVADCRCTYSLISSTFISTVPRRTVPTLREVSNALSRNFQVCAKGKTDLRFSKWRKMIYTLRSKRMQKVYHWCS